MEAPDQFRVWNMIGASFDETRPRPWPFVEAWLGEHPCPEEGGRLLDVMSGNGRHGAAAAALGWQAVALDWSSPLLGAAPIPAVRGDASRLPFADHSFGAALYIAGLHGIPSTGRRAASLQELRRVLHPGAPVLLSVWSRNAPRFAELGDGVEDVIVPWKRDGAEVPRTYHLYTPESLRAACEAAGFVVASCEDVAVSGRVPDNVVASLRA